MLEYTKAVFNQTIDDLKRISLVASFATQGVYIAYLVYAISVNVGRLYINIPLLVISLAYLVFTIVMERKTERRSNSKIRTKAKEAYRIAKYVILLPALISSVITLATLKSDHVTFSLLFTVMMILGYVLSILMLVITKVVENRFALFMVAIKADFEPVMNAYNTFRKFKGERINESTPSKVEQKMRSDLDAKVDKIKVESPPKPEKMSKEELKDVRREIIGSIASNVAEKARQKIESFTSKLRSFNVIEDAHSDVMPTDILNEENETADK
jgi:hypothetical protein